jgi:hypothetical protein
VALLIVGVAIQLPQRPARASAGTPWPLGTLTLPSGVRPPCLSGYTCQAFKVDQCNGVSQAATGVLAKAAPTTIARGMVLFFSGSKGTEWWTNGSTIAEPFLQGLRALGFWVVQVRWKDPWLLSAPGEDAGSAHMACRPATVVSWVHSNLYLPLGIQSAPEQCGFCITGNSGGSGQVTYAIAFYGLAPILDAVVATSGPTHTALTAGCLRQSGQTHFWFSDSESVSIDSSFGFNQQAGACVNHDASYTSRWNVESLDTGGNAFVYPMTRVEILLGATDCGDAPAHGAAFYDAITRAGTPYVSLSVISTMGHSIQSNSNGLAELQDALLDLPIGNLGAPCYPI